MSENPYCAQANQELRRFMEAAAKSKPTALQLAEKSRLYFDRIILQGLPETVRSDILLVMADVDQDSSGLNFILFERGSMIGVTLQHHDHKVYTIVDIDAQQGKLILKNKNNRLSTKPLSALVTQFTFKANKKVRSNKTHKVV